MESMVAISRDLDTLDKGANRRLDTERDTKRKCLYNLVIDGLRPVHVTLQCGTKAVFKTSNLE